MSKRTVITEKFDTQGRLIERRTESIEDRPPLPLPAPGQWPLFPNTPAYPSFPTTSPWDRWPNSPITWTSTARQGKDYMTFNADDIRDHVYDWQNDHHEVLGDNVIQGPWTPIA
jgi:hypothetical protein